MQDFPLLDQALEEAHLPSLLMTAVHLSGDSSCLTEDLRPVYEPAGDEQGGFRAEQKAQIRAHARASILRYLDSGPRPSEVPRGPTLERMVEFIIGGPVPEGYRQFIEEHLDLEGVDSARPRWTTPQLRAAAQAMRVIIVGAGLSGLLMAIRLQQAGIDFEIIEKNADVGGTWLENTYPGCRVDTPNHLYSYSFEPNHGWPQHFSKQAVLLDYFRTVADNYELRSRIRFNTVATQAVFDEARSRWQLHVRCCDGSEEVLECSALTLAVGQLNRPRLPQIEGLDSFRGDAFHSGAWRHDVDLRGKRVAVIGSGASALQVVPEIAASVERLVLFQRSAPWLWPTPNYHQDVGAGKRWLLENVPQYALWYRFYLFWSMGDVLFEGVQVDPNWAGPDTAVGAVNDQARAYLTNKLRESTGTLFEKMLPTYPVGGKRVLRDDGTWVRALERPNVDLVTDAIRAVTPEGVLTATGMHHDVDVIIYATGFHASRFLWPLKVIGREGRDLQTWWDGNASAYLGSTVANCPNLFCVFGPNTGLVAQGSLFFISECSVRYIMGCLQLLAERGHATLEPKGDVCDTFNRDIDAANRNRAWGVPHVSSWYKNDHGRVTAIWPYRLIDFWAATRAPNPDDFIFNGRLDQA